MAGAGDRRGVLQRGLEVAVAAAGLVAFVYVIGGGVTWLRLHTLKLPQAAPVVSLSRGALVTAGLNALLVPLTLGGLAAVATRLLSALLVSDQPSRRHRGRRRRPPTDEADCGATSTASWRDLIHGWRLAAPVADVVLAVVAIALLVVFHARWDYWLYVLVALLLPLVGVVVHWFGWPSAVAAFSVFLAMTAVAVVVEFWEVYSPPTHLEPVLVWLSKPQHELREPVDGFLLGENGSSVYVALREPTARTCRVDGRVFVFRRDDVERITVRRSVHVYPVKSNNNGSKHRCK